MSFEVRTFRFVEEESEKLHFIHDFLLRRYSLGWMLNKQKLSLAPCSCCLNSC